MVRKNPIPGETWEHFNSGGGFSRMTFKEWVEKGLPLSNNDLKKLGRKK